MDETMNEGQVGTGIAGQPTVGAPEAETPAAPAEGEVAADAAAETPAQ